MGCSKAPTNNSSDKTADKAGQCSWAANWNICFTNIIYVFTVGLGSALAYIASTILNTAVVLALDSNAYALQFITESWSLVRDLANMAFLFILIYIAFTIMLKAETSGIMQTLAMVIVMAVLINFSFFLTRVVIDGGNILAVQFYNNIGPVDVVRDSAAQPKGSSGSGITNGCLATLFKADLCKNARDLTAVIMNSIQIQNILGTDSFTALANDKNGGTAGAWVATLISLSLVYITMGVMFFMLMGAFLYAAVLFITRIVTLWLLIIVAPLAFAAEAIPAARFKGYYQEWQSMLISNTFYPAMFLFIFLVLSKLMESLGKSLGGTSFVGVGDSATFLSIIAGTVGVVVIKLGLVLGLLMVGLSFAKRVSTSMGETSQHLAGAVSGWAQGKVRGVAYGAAGMTYQQTVGRAASAANYGLSRTRFGNLWGVQQMRDLTLGKVAGSKVLGTPSYTDYTKQREEWRLERREGRETARSRMVVTDLKPGITNLMSDTRRKDLEKRLKTFSTAELEEAATGAGGTAKLSNLSGVAHLLSKNQFDGLIKSKLFGNAEKERFTKQWNGRGTADAAFPPAAGAQPGSVEAPINEADKLVDEIRKLAATTHSFDVATRTFNNVAVNFSRDRIAGSGRENMKQIIKAETNKLKADMAGLNTGMQQARRDNDYTTHRRLQVEREKYQEMSEKLKTLGEKIKDVKEHEWNGQKYETGDMDARAVGEHTEVHPPPPPAAAPGEARDMDRGARLSRGPDGTYTP